MCRKTRMFRDILGGTDERSLRGGGPRSFQCELRGLPEKNENGPPPQDRIRKNIHPENNHPLGTAHYLGNYAGIVNGIFQIKIIYILHNEHIDFF